MTIFKSYTKYFCLLSLFTLLSLPLTAQKDFTFYSLESTPQSHYVNPAFKPKANLYLGIPFLGKNSFGASNSGFNLNQLFTERAQDDSLVLDPQNALSKMQDRNFLTFDAHNSLLAFGFRWKKNYLSFDISNRMSSNFIYTKDFFSLLVEGNGSSFLGKRASFDGTEINLKSYFEYAVGFNREVSDKLSLGGRVKFLSGIANINTRESQFGLHTDANTFALTIDGKAIINTSGIKPFFDSTATSDDLPIYNPFNFNNFGIAFDLGAQYELTEKLSLSASVLDLGFIKWKENNATYQLEDIDYRFEGVYINQFLNDSTASAFEDLSDTLRSLFSQDESDHAYKTSLSTRFYIGATYDLTKNITLGATLYNEILRSKYRAAAIVSGTYNLKRWLSATVNYSQYARSFGNIGIGASFKAGPVQLFVVTDNVLGFFAPENSKNFHASFGVALMLGNPDED